jgi:hypothetical protein
LFDDLNTSEFVAKNALREAAQRVGFKHLEDVFQRAASGETLEAMLQRLERRGW